MNLICWVCNGRSWVPDGDIDDGMMTGRKTCPECNGNGNLTVDQVLEHIRIVLSKPRVPA